MALVDPQPVADGLLVVVGTVHQFAATLVATILQLGRREVDVVHLVAILAGAPTGEALHENLEVHVDEQGQVQGLVQLGEQLVESLGLGDVAGKTVEDEAALGVGLAETLSDHRQHDVVGDQLAGVHGRLGLNTELSTVTDLRAEQVTGGDLRNLVTLDQLLSLGSLTGARGA